MKPKNEGVRPNQKDVAHVTLIYGLQVSGALRLTGVGD